MSESPNKCHKCVRRLSATTFHQSYGPIFSLINFISPEISDSGAAIIAVLSTGLRLKVQVLHNCDGAQSRENVAGEQILDKLVKHK